MEGVVNIEWHGQHYLHRARRAGSDGSISASGSAGPGLIPGGVGNFNLKIFNLGARRGGDVHFQIARNLPQYIC